MNEYKSIELPAPAIAREQLDLVLFAATVYANERPEFYAVNEINTVGFLYLVNPEHTGHSAAELEPILCTLAYDRERGLYLVAPHWQGCTAHSTAELLYAVLCDEHKDGVA